MHRYVFPFSVPQVQKNLKATWGYLSDEERRCLNHVMGA